MSAATILEGQLHAHLHNAMEGYSTRHQLALAEEKIRELHARLLADEDAVVAYAVVARRPVLAEVAGVVGAIGIQQRDMLDGADPVTLLHYRGEALRALVDAVTYVEHIDGLLANQGVA